MFFYYLRYRRQKLKNKSKTNKRKDLIMDCSCNECSTNRSSCQVESYDSYLELGGAADLALWLDLNQYAPCAHIEYQCAPTSHSRFERGLLSKALSVRPSACVTPQIHLLIPPLWALSAALTEELTARKKSATHNSNRICPKNLVITQGAERQQWGDSKKKMKDEEQWGKMKGMFTGEDM